VIFTGIFLSLLAQLFLKLVFGQEWLLPYSVAIIMTAQEILRGIYQVNAVQLIAAGGKKAMTQISMLLIILSVSLITLGILFVGIWGAPTALIFVYLIVILSIKIKLKEITNVN
jgi:O-antigen/teichoic acid export membrane protein